MKPCDLPPRLAKNIEVDNSGCWLWTASTQPSGYAQLRVGTQMLYGHRLAFQSAHPEVDMRSGVIDHLCRVRRCVNPAHLELVTHRVNAFRGLPGVLGSHTSRYLGVTLTPSGRWRARVTIEGKRVGAGTHDCEMQAALAVDDLLESAGEAPIKADLLALTKAAA